MHIQQAMENIKKCANCAHSAISTASKTIGNRTVGRTATDVESDIEDDRELRRSVIEGWQKSVEGEGTVSLAATEPHQRHDDSVVDFDFPARVKARDDALLDYDAKDRIERLRKVATDYMEDKQYDLAQEAFEKVMRESQLYSPSGFEWKDKTMKFQGICLCERGKLDEAKVMVIQERFVGVEEVMEILVTKYCVKEAWDEVETILKQTFDRKWGVIARIACNFCEVEEWQAAAWLAKHPEIPGRDMILKRVSTAYFQAGRFDELESLLAFNFDSKTGMSLLLANKYRELSEWEGAIRVLKRLYDERMKEGLAIDDVAHSLANVFLRRGDHDEAKMWCRRAIDARKDFGGAGQVLSCHSEYLLAQIYTARRDIVEARTCTCYHSEVIKKGKSCWSGSDLRMLFDGAIHGLHLL